MTPLEFREALSTFLVNELGQYKRGDGTFLPAFWVGVETPDGHKIDSEYPKLLECVVSGMPLLEQIKEFPVRSTQEHYRVVLKDWSSVYRPNQAPQGTSRAMKLILENFEVIGTPVPIPATRELIETYSAIVKI